MSCETKKIKENKKKLSPRLRYEHLKANDVSSVVYYAAVKNKKKKNKKKHAQRLCHYRHKSVIALHIVDCRLLTIGLTIVMQVLVHFVTINWIKTIIFVSNSSKSELILFTFLSFSFKNRLIDWNRAYKIHMTT